jgi:hypothetical protein
MKQIIYISLISIFIFSCTSNTIYEKPENLIPRDEMVDILVDMQLALGAKSIKNFDGNKNVDYMYLVYEKYQIDSARFAESNFYYMTNIDEFNKVLRKSKNKIQVMKKEYENIRKKRDSIANPITTELNDNMERLSKKDRNVDLDTLPIVR